MKIKRVAKSTLAGKKLASDDQKALGAMAAIPSASPTGIQNILVPVDFSDFSVNALQYALPMAAKFGARLRLLHVVAPVPYSGDMMLIPSEMEDMNAALENDGLAGLKKLVREKLPRNVATSVTVRVGRSFTEIVAEGRDWPADLIIMGTHGRTGLMHVLVGSTTERVVRLAHCPVLVVRIPEPPKA